jgi:hypothetical protein
MILNVKALEDPDFTFTISPNDYRAVGWDYVPSGYKIVTKTEVVAGGNKQINLYLLDQENYDRYKEGGDVYALVSYEGITYKEFNYTVSTSDGYWVVYENPANFIYSKDVETIVDAVKVQEEETDGGDSNGGFTVSDYITITSPEWGDVYRITEGKYSVTCNIEWDYGGDVDYVDISLYKNGEKIEVLDLSVGVNETYEWTIYDTDEYYGSGYQIGVEAVWSNASDMSGTFSIYTSEPYIEASTGTSFITGGLDLTVRWECTPDIEYVDIELYKGSEFIKEVAAYVDASRHNYTWDLAENIEGTNIRIRVESSWDDSIYGYTDYFEVRKPSNPWIPILIFAFSIVGIVAVIGGGIYVIKKKKGSTPQSREKSEANRELDKQEEAEIQRAPEGKMFCPHCGSEIAADSQFCRSCGSEIK